ncbi:MAG: bile acid:sodium symporter family protein [Deltaproteobacteria bacterium]
MGAYIIKIIMVSVMFLMLGAGLNIEFRQVFQLVKRLRIVVLGVIANFLIVPLLIYLCIKWLPFSPDIKIGIMLMAAAPIAPMAPTPFVEKAKGDVVYSVGLMVLVAILSIGLTPLILTISIPKSVGGVTLDPIQIVKTLLMVQLIPICAGMVVRHISSTWAEKLLKFIPRIGQIGLIVGVGLLFVQQGSQMLRMGFLVYLIMLFLVIVSLLVGDWILVGESGERRRALAISTAIRNIPLAFLIATENFPDTVIGPVTLVFSAFTMVISVVYGKMMADRKNQRAKT